MFYYCKNFTNINISNFNTSNVINMENMFCGCENLINLDLSSLILKMLNVCLKCFMIVKI